MRPIDKLEEAVRVFVEETGSDEALANWVIGYQTTRIEPDPGLAPLVSTFDLTHSLATTTETAIGLARLLEVRLSDIALDKAGL